MNNYAFPFERPIPRGGFDFCAGPGGRWAACVASQGIRVGLWAPGDLLDDSFGSMNLLFAQGQRPEKVSICFDNYDRMVMAIKLNDTQIAVRFFQQADILPQRISADMTTIDADTTTITADNFSSGSLVALENIFPGISPILFFNGISSIDSLQADAICFYLKDSDPQSIYCRFLADNFGVEYTMNGGLPVNLVALLKADLIHIGGRDHLILWAMTDDGRQVFLRSEAYAPEVIDRLSFDQTTGVGLYINPPSIPTLSDALTIDASLQNSFYSPTILPNAAPPDALTVDCALTGGLYIATVLPTTTPADRLTVAQTMTTGSYA